MSRDFYPPFHFEWHGAADGGIWVVGWPGLEPMQYRHVSFPKRLNARRAYRRWLDEQINGKVEVCPTCHGQGHVRTTSDESEPTDG